MFQYLIQYHVSGSSKLWEHFKFWRDFRFSFTGTERYCILQLLCSIHQNSWRWPKKKESDRKTLCIVFLYPFWVKIIKKKKQYHLILFCISQDPLILKTSIMTWSKTYYWYQKSLGQFSYIHVMGEKDLIVTNLKSTPTLISLSFSVRLTVIQISTIYFSLLSFIQLPILPQ